METFILGVVIAAGVAGGLALFQYVVTPFIDGIVKLKEIIDERGSRTK